MSLLSEEWSHFLWQLFPTLSATKFKKNYKDINRTLTKADKLIKELGELSRGSLVSVFRKKYDDLLKLLLKITADYKNEEEALDIIALKIIKDFDKKSILLDIIEKKINDEENKKLLRELNNKIKNELKYFLKVLVNIFNVSKDLSNMLESNDFEFNTRDYFKTILSGLKEDIAKLFFRRTFRKTIKNDKKVINDLNKLYGLLKENNDDELSINDEEKLKKVLKNLLNDFNKDDSVLKNLIHYVFFLFMKETKRILNLFSILESLQSILDVIEHNGFPDNYLEELKEEFNKLVGDLKVIFKKRYHNIYNLGKLLRKEDSFVEKLSA